VKLFRDLDDLPEECRGGAVAIGNFDGVHVGHAAIVRRLVARARQARGPAVVLTFDPPPARLLRGDQAPLPLTGVERKARLLAELGVDAVIAYPTDDALLRLDAQQFFHRIVRDRLDARALVEGPNFFFGRGRQGNVEVLAELCNASGLVLEVVEPVVVDGQMVSSSRIRALISQGRMEEARRMLTRPYRVRGIVIHGAGRGARLGYPTANLSSIETLLPGEGIFAGRAQVDGRLWPAAMSVGPNPTFGEQNRKVEAFLIGFQGDLYDRQLEVDFLTRLRDIERFDSVESLLAEMSRDVAAAVRIAGEESGEWSVTSGH